MNFFIIYIHLYKLKFHIKNNKFLITLEYFIKLSIYFQYFNELLLITHKYDLFLEKHCHKIIFVLSLKILNFLYVHFKLKINF